MSIRFIGGKKPECAPVNQPSVPAFTLTTSDGGNTYTKTGLSFGAAHSTRSLIFAFAFGGGPISLSGITIGGVSATVIETVTNGQTVYIAHARVPSGTSGTITISLSSAASITPTGAIYRCRFLRSIAAIAHGHDSNSSSSTPMSVSLNMPNHGVAIGVAAGNVNAGETPSVTFSGVTFSAGGAANFTSGHQADVAANPSYAVTCVISNARPHALAAAAFR